ncbi:hypothetical protein C8Q80DRAFT_1193622 [Daedaleopsis nitida]|nr:hypothetical protein C8Q80DRAFT_1193622 [Daedaleopsis nitida]
MGRRKIEIQPITHERNRSVTFLKRKNGLFKKAYELGVLCSVDVAVIIFEERPGHHAKLYQYCSTDVNGMVSRHIRFDGERDTKGPPDFNNTKRVDEAVDDDEDDIDDDDPSQKRRDSTKGVKVKSEASNNSIVPIRPGPDVSTSPELDYRGNLRVSPTASTSSSSLPISGERHTSAITSATRSVPISSTAKRPRLGVEDGGAHMHSSPASLNSGSNHHPGGGSPTFPFQLNVDLPSSYSIPSLSQLHSSHPSLTSLYPGGMANIMSGPGGGPGASFLSQQYGHGQGHAHGQGQAPTLRAVTFPHSSQSPFSPHGHQQAPSLFGRSANAGHGQNSAGLFAELLGSAGEGAHAGTGGGGGGGGGQFPGFDWPVHSAQASQQGTQGQHENDTSHSSSAPNDSNWFDIFSGSSTTTSGPGGGGGGSASALSLPPPVPPLNSARFGMSPGMGRKRLRDEGVGSDSGESDELRRERERGEANGGDRKS